MRAKVKKLTRTVLQVRRHPILLALAAFVLLVIFLTLLDGWFAPVAHPQYGASFSKLRADELGIDWKANFTALLDDLHLKHFRLMSYWSEFEPARGHFDFSDLDWQMSQAAQHHAKVTLVIGVRQPRWPECYQPAWADQLQGNAWKQALYAYMEVVIKRYQHHPALATWQLENEPLNNWFGRCPAADATRLKEEFALVRKLDPSHPIVITLSDEHGLPINPPVPDAYGFSVYRTIYNAWGGVGFYFTYPAPLWYHRLRATIITAIHQRPTYIHELQLEPWGPKDTKLLSIQEQDRSMSAAEIHQNITFGRKLGMQQVDLWGSEWWYWRKVHFNDSSIWNAVKSEVTATQ